MSSAQSLREFIRQRLTAAAEEIFSEVDKTIVHYEEELDRQSRLLEICWKPQIKLQRIDFRQHFVWKEQQFCGQERNSTLDHRGLEPQHMKEEQDEPERPEIKEELEEIEPAQIKDEQEEFRISLDQEQLLLQQDTYTCMVNSTHEERDHREPEPNCDRQLVQISSEPENHKQESNNHEDSRRDKELNQKRRHQKRRLWLSEKSGRLAIRGLWVPATCRCAPVQGT
ncbi:hypothetical protein CRENBAI_003056 [Crenichthys baileyi]|uniref:Uncharacterized protein n=1 Tax=Crenichthys baileyi TaxID=28760 RepID=A0AAV9S647_9TELE